MPGTDRPVTRPQLATHTLLGLLVLSAASARAETAPATPPEAGWAMPYIFLHREASATLALNAPEFQGKSFAFVSSGTPEMAKVLGRQMQAAGLTVVPPDTEGAVTVELHFGAWVAPPRTPARRLRNIPLADALDKALADAAVKPTSPDGSTVVAAANASTGGPGTGVVVPLGGYKTPIGQTGVSAGAAGFLVQNLGNATGLSKWFNGLFGGDERGICIGSAVNCDQNKGPIGEVEIKGTAKLDDRTVEIASRVIVIQNRNNLGQPLAYAIGDWRDAALGKATPRCLSLANEQKQKTPGCEPTMPTVAVEDFFQ
jgi:hypothetical protein